MQWCIHWRLDGVKQRFYWLQPLNVNLIFIKKQNKKKNNSKKNNFCAGYFSHHHFKTATHIHSPLQADDEFWIVIRSFTSCFPHITHHFLIPSHFFSHFLFPKIKNKQMNTKSTFKSNMHVHVWMLLKRMPLFACAAWPFIYMQERILAHWHLSFWKTLLRQKIVKSQVYRCSLGVCTKTKRFGLLPFPWQWSLLRAKFVCATLSLKAAAHEWKRKPDLCVRANLHPLIWRWVAFSCTPPTLHSSLILWRNCLPLLTHTLVGLPLVLYHYSTFFSRRMIGQSALRLLDGTLCFVVHWASTIPAWTCGWDWDTDSVLFSVFFQWSRGIVFLSPGNLIHEASWQWDCSSAKLSVEFHGMLSVSSFIPHDFPKRFRLLVLQHCIWIFTLFIEVLHFEPSRWHLSPGMTGGSHGRPTATVTQTVAVRFLFTPSVTAVISPHAMQTQRTLHVWGRTSVRIFMAERSTVQLLHCSTSINENRRQMLSVWSPCKVHLHCR